MNHPYAAVREAMRQDSPFWRVEHVDITCDGCECEPIIGKRFKCTVCEDIDLCGACMRALVAARVKMAQEAAPLPAPRQQGRRPRKWVSKLHSKDLSQKWSALQTVVPCLHPSHQFLKIVDGPERAIVFTSPADSNHGAEELSHRQQGQERQQVQQQQQQQQQESQQQGPQKTIEACSGDGAVPNSGPPGLETFLQTFRPSVSSCRDVAWIVVECGEAARTPHRQQQQQQQQQQGQRQEPAPDGTALDQRVDAAVEEWEQLARAAAKSGRALTAADVEALALKHRILRGKWMLFARSGAEADAAWSAVARAVCAQPPLCRSAKVSSAGPDGDASWVLLAYTEDCTDREDVQRVRRRLQQAIPAGLLRDRRLLYKPDIYTHLGIYSKNEWQLKPTVYKARLA